MKKLTTLPRPPPKKPKFHRTVLLPVKSLVIPTRALISTDSRDKGHRIKVPLSPWDIKKHDLHVNLSSDLQWPRLRGMPGFPLAWETVALPAVTSSEACTWVSQWLSGWQNAISSRWPHAVLSVNTLETSLKHRKGCLLFKPQMSKNVSLPQ